ncbi:hypothetical protein PAXRUDRAFT_556185 [Paxillus rubicundulus Ve08.2h10]|uniref:Uncharacterized protein n=1 Tax=Paxillus rubicundulus Ve08.2h10 TaxID=930991 RepID=A0A0D0BRW2_9AGAM|nr:hypothetical protein PAXRUDRAFT_556185 [Paxillus rubicundulus Ve08.2h10]
MQIGYSSPFATDRKPTPGRTTPTISGTTQRRSRAVWSTVRHPHLIHVGYEVYLYLFSAAAPRSIVTHSPASCWL